MASYSNAAASGTALTISANTATGWHVLKVRRYSQTKGVVGVGNAFSSSAAFAVGSHRWRVDVVRAEYVFSLLDRAGAPVPEYTKTYGVCAFSAAVPAWGFERFVKRAELEASPYLDDDDSFSVRCDVTVYKESPAEMITAAPSSGRASRLRGPARRPDDAGDGDGSRTSRRQYDMEARVFLALLRFIYTDSLPDNKIDEGDRAEMTKKLLAAADRYRMQKLKRICADTLLGYVDSGTVAAFLALAEQHGCQGLKEACFKFLEVPGNLRLLVESDGFDRLATSCPSVLKELLLANLDA
ncbi:hypothetical protein PAHAL_8G234500 [Panicum hallii]|uniref:MATH domain-containing protein n=1 Tax=Panicum hallii TaxID=206008 RepID=A0A2T8I9Z3_9POAL|nr:hypothetical protein PAHAL_8G234500 [Panicum hallii]